MTLRLPPSLASMDPKRSPQSIAVRSRTDEKDGAAPCLYKWDPSGSSPVRMVNMHHLGHCEAWVVGLIPGCVDRRRGLYRVYRSGHGSSPSVSTCQHRYHDIDTVLWVSAVFWSAGLWFQLPRTCAVALAMHF